MKPTEGTQFVHSRLRGKRGEPVICEVTRVTVTGVYYEEVITGKRRSVDGLAFSGVCKVLVVPEPAFSG